MKKIHPLISRVSTVLAASILVYFVFIFASNNIYAFYLENKYPLNYRDFIVQYSGQYDLDPSLVSAVIYEESRFRPNSSSDKGAIGLMQLLPETASYIAGKTNDNNFKPESLGDIEQNIKYGCYYLSYLYTRYEDWDKTLAAYNAGEGNVDKWIEEGDYQVKFKETKNFVEKVKSTQGVYNTLYFKVE